VSTGFSQKMKQAVRGCLAPTMVAAIAEGRQPASLSARTTQDTDPPLACANQRALLGFTRAKTPTSLLQSGFPWQRRRH